MLSATISASFLKYTLCKNFSKLRCQDIFSYISLDLVGVMSILGHFYYKNLALCDCYLYLFIIIFQFVLFFKYKLDRWMGKVFKNVISLYFFATCIDLNSSSFIPNLLFNKVAVAQLIRNNFSFESNRRNKEDNSCGNSKIEFDIKKDWYLERNKNSCGKMVYIYRYFVFRYHYINTRVNNLYLNTIYYGI